MAGSRGSLVAAPRLRINSHCDSSVERHAFCAAIDNTLNRKLVASKVYTRLPREIRNRVYAFCVQGSYDNEVIVRRAVGTKEKCIFLTRRVSGSHSYQWIEDPIASIIDVRILGVEVAREMLEMYYWTRVFKFSHHESYLLVSFLTTDTFGLAMYPADYARHLHLRIQPQGLFYRMPGERISEMERCLAAIEALASIRTTCTEIVFDLDLAHSMRDDLFQEDSMMSSLPDMEQVAQALNARGLRTKIAYSRAWNQ